MRTLKPPVSMISGFLNVSLLPKTIFLILSDPGYLKYFKQKPNRFGKTYSGKCQNLGNLKFWKLWKRQAPKNPNDPSKEILRILDMESISSRKHEMEIGNKTKKLRNFWHFTIWVLQLTRFRNSKTFKLSKFEILAISTTQIYNRIIHYLIDY